MTINDLKSNAADPKNINAGAPKAAPKPTVGPNGKPVINKPSDTVATPVPRKDERITLDLTNIAAPRQANNGVEVRESPIKDILDESNPDSPFAKYLTRKEAEMDEYLEELDQAQELAENDFIDEDGNNTADDGAQIGMESVRQIEEKDERSTSDMSEYDVATEDTSTLNVSVNVGGGEDNSSTLNIDLTGGSKEDVEVEEVEVDEEPAVEETVEEVVEEEIPVDNAPAVDESDEFEVDMDKELEEEEETPAVENIMETKEEPKKEEKPKSVTITDEDDIDVETSSVDNDTSDLDVEDEEASQIQDTDDDETLKELRRIATETLKPAAQTLDIKSFTIAKKPSANLRLLKESESKAKAAKWVLPAQNSIFVMKEFLGAELEELRSNSENTQSLMQLTRRYRMIYDHIVSGKPTTFEAWTKVTPFADSDHYFFGAYIASFKGTNFMPMTCRNKDCGKMSLSKDIPVLDMVKFDDDEAKARFLELYKSTRETPRNLYATEVIPLSHKVAISFKEASIYSLFEIASLDDNFKAKHSSIIDYVPYIDSMYQIDMANNSLIPVGYKVYPDNAVKTTKSKITMFSKVLNTLNIDEFGPVKAYVSDLITRRDNAGFKYILPEMSCPHCGTKIDELNTSAEELLFTRYQLGALMNTSIN